MTTDALCLLIEAEDWRAAMSLASKRKGIAPEQMRAILGAREAYARPDFQRQLRRDPDALIAAGIAALKVLHGKWTKPV